MARPKSNRKFANAAKTAARKPAEAKKASAPKTREAVMKLLKETTTSKRPPANPSVPNSVIKIVNEDLNTLKEILEQYAQHMRALDRKRLNGVGIKKLGFIEAAYELALENSEFLPHYLTIERFGKDVEYLNDFRALIELNKQLHELLWNIATMSSDIAYTDALEFYSSVREAAKRRVDAAETLYAALSPFFKSWGKRHETEGAEPTKKQQLKIFKGLESGKHEGVLFMENQKPKLTGGKRKFIDESFKDSVDFKDIDQGEITE